MTAFDFQPEFRKTVLSNGVRIVTEHHPFSRSVSAAIFVQLGTRDEPENMNGSAHFIEHLVFKGTQSRSAFEIAKSLEAVGGDLNAYTSRELTCFHASCLREHLSLALDVLVDLVGKARFDLNEFKKEREVIRQEIDMSTEIMEEYIFDLFFEKIYSGHPLGRSILGTHESLNKISRHLLYGFYRECYGNGHLVVSIAGDVNHDEVVVFVEKKLGRRKLNIKKQKRSSPSHQPFVEIVHRPSEQIHILLGFPSGSFKDKYRFESYIVNAALGGGMTSRLYQKIREEQGLAYSIYSYLQSFTDSGLLMVYAGASEKNTPQVLHILAREIKKLMKQGLSKKELDFFKTQVKGAILLGSDDVENRMNSIAINEMVFKNYRSIDSVMTEIDEIKPESVMAYLQQFFDLKKLGLMLMGDVPESTAFDWVSDSFKF